MKAIMRGVKTCWILFWACLFSVILFLPIVAVAFISRTGNIPFTMSKWWAYGMLFVSLVRTRITGREKIKKGQSYIIISNHQSMYDILALVTTLKIQFRWVIKKEILKIPLFGYALYASRNIFIDRGDINKAKESIQKGLTRLPAGTSVTCFAEGTRSHDGRLGKFKKGGFYIALERGIPILPVTVNGSRRILPKGTYAFNPGTIDVVVADPIETAGYTHETIEKIMEKTWKVINSNLVQ